MEMAAEMLMLARAPPSAHRLAAAATDTGLKHRQGGSRVDAPTLDHLTGVRPRGARPRSRGGAPAPRRRPCSRLINAGLVAGERVAGRERCGSTFFDNAIFFKKVQKLIGGRVRLMIWWLRAPVARDADLHADVLPLPAAPGLRPHRDGLGGHHLLARDLAHTDERVGQVLTSVRVTLKDWEEGGYRTADANDPAIGMPRGEVLIGGPVVCQGYYTAGHMADRGRAREEERHRAPSSTRASSTPATSAPSPIAASCSSSTARRTS